MIRSAALEGIHDPQDREAFLDELDAPIGCDVVRYTTGPAGQPALLLGPEFGAPPPASDVGRDDRRAFALGGTVGEVEWAEAPA